MNEENELTYFKGGLALGVGLGLVGGIVQYEFTADAYTGTVIDIQRLKD